MAQTLPNGAVVPNESGNEIISATGVAEMRALGASVDAQLGDRSRVGHTHSQSDVSGLGTALAAKANLAPSPLGTENLNTLVTDGLYYQRSSANATLARNYPEAMAGSLRVIQGGSTQVQQFYTTYFRAASEQYWRVLYDGVWGAWRAVADATTVIKRSTLASNIDLNLLRLAGEYAVAHGTAATLLNAPPGVSTGVVKVVQTPTTVWMQMYWSYGGAGTGIWVRRSTNAVGGWSTWDRLLSQSDMQTALVGKVDNTDPRLTNARQPTAHTHTVAQVEGLGLALEGFASKAQLEGVANAYDVAQLLGFEGTMEQWRESLKGDKGDEGPYGGTVATDPQVASYLTSETETRATLDRGYRRGVSVLEYGATGDGVTDDTAAFTAALATGRTVHVPEGDYVVSGATATTTVDFVLASGAVIHHAGTGSAIHVTGSESNPVAITVDVTAGATTVTAPGHGVAAGDWVRLGSDRLYDASSTRIRGGELVQVAGVTGDVLTLATPVQGGPYPASEGAVVSRLSMVEGVTVRGAGKFRGAFTPGLSQTGIRITLARKVQVVGIVTEGFDYRHIAPEDTVDTVIWGTSHEWALSAGMGYGIAVTNAAQDTLVHACTFRNVRHAFTTSNQAAVRGIVRHATVRDCVVRYSAPATGGSPGDALDSHTAAEDINFLSNTVIGASGAGINHEGRSGRIIGNVIIDAGSHGITVHNESDHVGSIEVRDNRLIRIGGVGVRVTGPTRGSVALTEGVWVTGNYFEGVKGSHVIRVGITSSPIVCAVIITGNISKGATGEFVRTQNTEAVVERDNLAISGGASITVAGRVG